MQANRAPQIASLYIGDLHPQVTEAQLYELFNGIGPVASIRVCRDKINRQSLGYGYVNFHNAKDAETALDTLSYTQINGRSCRLMWSQKDAGGRKACNSNVYVSNLDKNIDNKALHDTFSVFGEVRSCKVAADAMGNSYGYGFVHFETAEAALDAIARLNDMEVSGRRIQVCMCENRKEATNSVADFTNLYVKCFPETWDEEMMREEFGKFGAVTGVAVRSDTQGRRCAFVNFERHEDAKACIKAMHMRDMRSPEESQDEVEEVGADGHPLNRLYVQRAQPKAEREQMLKQQYGASKTQKSISLYVKGLSEDTTDQGLRLMFEAYGQVISATAPHDSYGKCRGFGFVRYGTVEEATKAVSMMHLQVINGRAIHVDLAQSKEDREARRHVRANQRLSAPFNAPFRPPMGMGPMAARPGGMMPMGPMGPIVPGMGPMGGPCGHMGSMGKGQSFPNPTAYPGRPIGPWPASNMSNMSNMPMGYANGVWPSRSTRMVTPATLSSMPPHMQKQLLGEKLHAEIVRMHPGHAGKITGMMLEMDNSDIIALLDSPEQLQMKVSEAMAMLE